VLGSNLYQNNQINPQISNKIAMNTEESPITLEEANGIKNLLFKDGKGHLHDSWMQGFFFDSNIRYGIKQVQGGPCGILATV